MAASPPSFEPHQTKLNWVESGVQWFQKERKKRGEEDREGEKRESGAKLGQGLILRKHAFSSNMGRRFKIQGVFMECEVVGMGEVGKRKAALTQIAVWIFLQGWVEQELGYQFLYRCSYQLSLQKYSVYCIAATFYECYTARSSHIEWDSGGPLLDHLRRLIWIVVASAPNFGFAIPIDSVMSCAGKLLKLEKAMGSTDEAMEGSTDMEIDVSERRLSYTVSYDDGEGEDETIIYDASFQEMEDNYVKYQTAQ